MRMVPNLEGRVGWGGGDSSNEIERGGAGPCGSALHPKILCELLDLQEIFSVDCGTGGGQGPQHVRLQTKRTFFDYCQLKLGSDVGPGLVFTRPRILYYRILDLILIGY